MLLSDHEDTQENGWFGGHLQCAGGDHLKPVLTWGWRVDREYFVLTKPDIEELRRLNEATGVGPISLLKGAENVPEGLSAHMIKNWLGGRVKKARKYHYDFVLKAWRTLPPYIPITRRMIEDMETGADCHVFIFLHKIGGPKKLDSTVSE